MKNNLTRILILSSILSCDLKAMLGQDQQQNASAAAATSTSTSKAATSSSSASAASAPMISTGLSSRAQEVSADSSSEFIGSAFYEMSKNFKASGRIWKAFARWEIRYKVFEYLLTSLEWSDPSFRICCNISCVYGATFREYLKIIYDNANRDSALSRVIDQVSKNINNEEGFKPHINDIIVLSFLPKFQNISPKMDYQNAHSIFATISKNMFPNLFYFKSRFFFTGSIFLFKEEFLLNC